MAAAMGESIYTWIKPPPEVPVKPALYHAKAPADAPLAGSTFKPATHSKGWGTLGAELKGTVRPENFLKAREKTGHLETKALPRAFHRPPEETASKKAGVPRLSELPKPAARPARDFITDNAISAILAQPRRVEKKEPDYLYRPGFGRTPRYLQRVKAELEAERAYILDMLDAQQSEQAAAAGGAVRELTQGERDELIHALKSKWDEVSKKYGVIAHRKISTANATVGEIRWKENCERLMSQIEGDIKRLSVNAPIYIADE